MADLTRLGAILRATREASGLSLEQAAALSGLDHRLIGRYERDGVEPSLSRYARLCKAYRVSPATSAREAGIF